MKKFRDCQLKGIILQCLVDEDKTSEQIYQHINIPDYPKQHLFSELYALKRRGYLSRDAKTRTYRLNKKAHEHVANPYISIQKRRDNIQLKVNAILENEEVFKQAVRVEVENRIGSGGNHVSSGHGGPISQPASSVNDEAVQKLLQAKDVEIEKLQRYVLHLRRESQSQSPQNPQTAQPSTTLSPEQQQQQQQKQKDERQRIRRRRRISEFYASRNLPIDARFLAEWNRGNDNPIGVYKFKFKGWWSKNSLAVIGRSNPELSRKHVLDKPLDQRGLMMANIRITGMDQSGISIAAPALQDGKGRLRY